MLDQREKISSPFSFLTSEVNKLYCFNRWEFEKYCKNQNWDTDHIPENSAFISICGTDPVQEYVLHENEPHYFSVPNGQFPVLNLNFDDISEDFVLIESTNECAVGITLSQADLAVKFIRNNIGKDFYIHCRAGHSRSQAFVRYILDMYDMVYDFQIRPENPPTSYNQYVKSKLNKAARLLGEDIRVGLIREGYKIEYMWSSWEANIPASFVILKVKLEELDTEFIKRSDGTWLIPSHGMAESDFELWEILRKATKP